jgi:hypothetical protein
MEPNISSFSYKVFLFLTYFGPYMGHNSYSPMGMDKFVCCDYCFRHVWVVVIVDEFHVSSIEFSHKI